MPLQNYRHPDRFDGEKAFTSIIQPYSNYSEMELDCELWERSPYRLLDEPSEKDFSAVLESLYDPDDMLFVGTPLANAAEQHVCGGRHFGRSGRVGCLRRVMIR